MTKEERQTKKELNQLVYPNHLKYLKKLKSDLKKHTKTNMNKYRQHLKRIQKK
tara:strand:+ start:461 stop:619 length:159 start_codon:yes stop_codon:yes gene_type:complete